MPLPPNARCANCVAFAFTPLFGKRYLRESGREQEQSEHGKCHVRRKPAQVHVNAVCEHWQGKVVRPAPAAPQLERQLTLIDSAPVEAKPNTSVTPNE